VKPALRHVHVGMYGAVMGLAGLGLTARAAAPVWPGVLRAPAYFTEPWVLAGLIALGILIVLYAIKLARDPRSVREDFINPLTLGFCGAFPVGMSLVAGGIGAYFPLAGRALWWLSFALLIAFQVWALARLLSGGIELAQVNAGWLIILVGGIVLPGPAIALGLAAPAHFAFGISATVAPILMALLFYRAIAGPAFPDGFRPTWFILLVPPSLIYANGLALYPQLEFLETLYFFALALAAALLLVSRRFWRWPFGPAWWAFTFPLDALAYAAVHFAQQHPSALWRTVAGAALLLATLFVSVVLLRSLAAILRSASSPPA
jgi:tellurite resistance protein